MSGVADAAGTTGAAGVTGMQRAFRLGVALALAATGYVHADLYLNGYRTIPFIGPAFLLQASGSFAVALLLVLGAPRALQLAAAALAGGALVGFALSRTVGVAGFVERGLQPAPQAQASLVAESAVLVLVAGSLLLLPRKTRPSPASPASIRQEAPADRAATRGP